MNIFYKSSMGFASRKLNLINWISGLQDENLVTRIETIKNEKDDWWEHISDEEKADIESGLAQLDKGESIPHNQVMEKYSKWR